MFAFLGCQKERNKNKKDVLKFCVFFECFVGFCNISLSFYSETAEVHVVLNHFDKNLAVLLFVFSVIFTILPVCHSTTK